MERTLPNPNLFKKITLAFFTLFLSCYIFYSHLCSENPIIGDAYTFYIPNQISIFKALRIDGELPLSDWHKAAGHIPMHERPNVPSLYIPNILLYMLYPQNVINKHGGEVASHFQVIPLALHALISSFALLLLLITLFGSNKIKEATLLSITWLLCPSLWSMIWFMSFFFMVCWLPVCCLGLSLIYKGQRSLGAMITTLSFTFALTAGYFSGIHYFIAGLLLFVIAINLGFGLKRKELMIMGFSLILGLLLAGYQLGPMISRLLNSGVLNQTGAILSATQYDFKPVVYLSILFANFFGDYGIIKSTPELVNNLFGQTLYLNFYEWAFYLGILEILIVGSFFWTREKSSSELKRFVLILISFILVILAFSLHINFNGLNILGFKLSKSIFGIHGKHRFFFVAQFFFLLTLGAALTQTYDYTKLKKNILIACALMLIIGTFAGLSTNQTHSYQGNILISYALFFALGLLLLFLAKEFSIPISLGLCVIVLCSRVNFGYLRYFSMFNEIVGTKEKRAANLFWDSSDFFKQNKDWLNSESPLKNSNLEFHRNGFALFNCNAFNDQISPDASVTSGTYEIGGYDLYRYFRTYQMFHDTSFISGNLDPYWYIENSVKYFALLNEKPFNLMLTDSRKDFFETVTTDKAHNHIFVKSKLHLPFASFYEFAEPRTVISSQMLNPNLEENRMNAYRVMLRPLVTTDEPLFSDLQKDLNLSIYDGILLDGITDPTNGAWITKSTPFFFHVNDAQTYGQIKTIYYLENKRHELSWNRPSLPISNDLQIKVTETAPGKEEIQFLSKGADILITEVEFYNGREKLALLQEHRDQSQKHLTAEIIKTSSNSVELTIQADRNGLILTQLPYLNHYKIFANDRLLQPLQVNYAKLGFQIEKGDHKIKIIYKPQLVIIFFWLSLIIILAMIGSVVWIISRQCSSVFNSHIVTQNKDLKL